MAVIQTHRLAPRHGSLGTSAPHDACGVFWMHLNFKCAPSSLQPHSVLSYCLLHMKNFHSFFKFKRGRMAYTLVEAGGGRGHTLSYDMRNAILEIVF